MTSIEQAEKILDEFLASRKHGKITETEIIEAKKAENSFSDNDLGKYFSALSNEANLKGEHCAWLIFGVTNSGELFGTHYMEEIRERGETKKKLADACTEKRTFLETHEIIREGKRILMLEVPAAPGGIPIAFKGHYYARDGESLVPLSPQKYDQIRSPLMKDWSIEIVPEATLDDLDEKAIAFAREKYCEKHPELAEEMQMWDTAAFLNKSKITIKSKITRAAILLLGKPESDHFISPSQAKIKWILKDNAGIDRDYYIAECPLILAADKIYNKIINLKYRYLQLGTLFPEEVDQYAPYLIRESLHNAIAHQDYALNGVITVVQDEDTLKISNPGRFIPETIENVLESDAPEKYYRNAFLANAMVNYKMSDTIGSGIKRMFNLQKDRYFPLPDYTLTESSVEVMFTGKVLDLEYANRLIRDKNLSLSDIILLDKVQKRKELTLDETQYLRKKKLICGRKPNIIISSSLAASTGQKAAHSKLKGLTTLGYETVILDGIKSYKSLTRKDIDSMLDKVLPDMYTEQQKKTKVNHLLTKLRKDGKISNVGTVAKPIWVLNKHN